MKRPKDSVETLMKSKDSTNALSNHALNLTALKDLSINITNSNIQKSMPLFPTFNLSLVKRVHKKSVIKNNSQMISEIQTQSSTVYSKNLVIWKVLQTLKLMNSDFNTLKTKKIKKINVKIFLKRLISKMDWALKSNSFLSSKRKNQQSQMMEIRIWKEAQELSKNEILISELLPQLNSQVKLIF